MADAAPKVSKQGVVEAFLLACSHSLVTQFITPEALRTVLELEFVDLIAGGSFDLQAVWELLEEQPSFDASAVGPPMCVFKSWEDRIGLLPPGKLARVLAEVADAERTAARDAERRAHAREAAEAGHSAAPSVARGRFGAWVERHRGTVLALASLVGVSGLGVAGVSALRGCRSSGHWSAARIDLGELPATDARRLGSQVGARLTDPRWLELPREQREAQLVAALNRLKGDDVSVLFLTDDSGAVRATVQRQGGRQPRVEVRFR
jgi:hypothetical protein